MLRLTAQMVLVLQLEPMWVLESSILLNRLKSFKPFASGISNWWNFTFQGLIQVQQAVAKSNLQKYVAYQVTSPDDESKMWET